MSNLGIRMLVQAVKVAGYSVALAAASIHFFTVGVPITTLWMWFISK